MVVEVEIKKWGNSLGVILPKELVTQQHLKEHEKIFIQTIKKANISDAFGSLKGKINLSGQEFKDLAREGWK